MLMKISAIIILVSLSILLYNKINTPTGKWSVEILDQEKCSKTCGGGTKNRKIVCLSKSTGQVIDNKSCDIKTKPSSTQACNEQDCITNIEDMAWRVLRSNGRPITRSDDDPEHKSILKFSVVYHDDGSYTMTNKGVKTGHRYLTLTVKPNGDGTSQVDGILNPYYWRDNQGYSTRNFSTTLSTPNDILGNNVGVKTGWNDINITRVQ